MTGRLRMTEQGEMINAKYGLRGIAMRSLEQTMSSVLWLTAREPPPHPKMDDWRRIMERIAAESRRAYQHLIYDSGDFARYFRDATPINVIERLNIGSRPLEQENESRKVEDVRAIPWVFAWTQTRCLLPGWYGFATGLASAMAAKGQDELREMHANWPFFKVLISDVEVVLAKADLDIASRYSQLAGYLHDVFFPVIKAEYDRCVDIVRTLTGHDELLADHATLRRSIRLRNPYMDPMSFLQVDLLERWRQGGRQDDGVLQALMVSVNGIAHGMQNTG